MYLSASSMLTQVARQHRQHLVADAELRIELHRLERGWRALPRICRSTRPPAPPRSGARRRATSPTRLAIANIWSDSDVSSPSACGRSRPVGRRDHNLILARARAADGRRRPPRSRSACLDAKSRSRCPRCAIDPARTTFDALLDGEFARRRFVQLLGRRRTPKRRDDRLPIVGADESRAFERALERRLERAG